MATKKTPVKKAKKIPDSKAVIESVLAEKTIEDFPTKKKFSISTEPMTDETARQVVDLLLEKKRDSEIQELIVDNNGVHPDLKDIRLTRKLLLKRKNALHIQEVKARIKEGK